MQDQKDSFKDRASPAETNLARQFGVNIINLLKAVKLYPPGHQMLTQTVQTFHRKTQQIIAQKSPVTLKIFKNKLYIQDICVSTAHDPEQTEFIEHLQSRYIRQILFYAGVDVEDLKGFADVLTSNPETLIGQGGASSMLTQKGITKNIKIIEYYYSQHSELNQEKLISLTNSSIFQFFIKDKMAPLSPEQQRHLQELIKDSTLIFALMKVAVQFLRREEATQLSESQIMLKILKKIKQAAIVCRVYEEEEVKNICRDIITAFDINSLFDLVFENIEDPTIEYAEAIPYLAGVLDTTRAAQLVIKKIVDSQQDVVAIDHARVLLGKIFSDRKAFLNSLPLLKEELQKNMPAHKTKGVLDKICSAFITGFSIEEGVDLDLGGLADSQPSDIATGLMALKNVSIEKEKIEKSIADFNADNNHLCILQTLLDLELAPDDFQIILDKLVAALKECLEKDNFIKSRDVFDFLTRQIMPESKLDDTRKQKIIEAQKNIPSLLIEKFIINTIFGLNENEARDFLEQLYKLSSKHLAAVLIKIYVRQEEVPNKALLQQLISDKFAVDFLKVDINWRQETANGIARFMDLFQNIKNDDVLPALWEITFHDDSLLSLRALKLISGQNSGRSLALLIKALKHPNSQIRLAGLEYMGSYDHNEARKHLPPVAREGFHLNDEYIDTECRIMALKSLLKIDKSTAKEIMQEILSKKKMLFVLTEPKKLCLFAKTQLKALQG